MPVFEGGTYVLIQLLVLQLLLQGLPVWQHLPIQMGGPELFVPPVQALLIRPPVCHAVVHTPRLQLAKTSIGPYLGRAELVLLGRPIPVRNGQFTAATELLQVRLHLKYQPSVERQEIEMHVPMVRRLVQMHVRRGTRLAENAPQGGGIGQVLRGGTLVELVDRVCVALPLFVAERVNLPTLPHVQPMHPVPRRTGPWPAVRVGPISRLHPGLPRFAGHLLHLRHCQGPRRLAALPVGLVAHVVVLLDVGLVGGPPDMGHVRLVVHHDVHGVGLVLLQRCRNREYCQPHD
mmetsp:Transcript_10486/g.23073  ORF Transcript_10486/g.23073 Transcript_10486/m.23073 type:complete len:290 (-) Transcript_10486:88-957(-)